MIVKDLYFDSIRFEETSLAHYIHHLIEEQKITLDDNISKIDLEQVDHHKVAELIQNNVLGIQKVGIYSLKMNQNDFVFIYACSQQKAIQFYTESFQQAPMNCLEYSLDFELTRGNDVISFRDMRREFMSFPAIAGYFKRAGLQRDSSLYRLPLMSV